MIRYIVRCLPVVFFLGTMILGPPRSAADVTCGNNVPTEHCATVHMNLSTGYVTYFRVTWDKTCLVRYKYTYNYEVIQDSQFVYNPPSGGQIPFNAAFTITQASPGYAPCPANGVSGNPGELLEQGYEVYVYGQSSPCCSVQGDYASGTFGYINPKYVVTDVRYAPPGSLSTAVYSTSTTVSNTESISSSFSTSHTVGTVYSTPIFTFFGGHAGSNSSTTVTQETQNSNATTITRTDTDKLTTPGSASDYFGVDHANDIIDVWINPVVLFTVYNTNVPGETKVATWGYGSSGLDLTAPIDIWPIKAGCLNGDIDPNGTDCAPLLNSTNGIFLRPWAAYPAEIWPAGEGAALTQADLANILAADPWGSCTRNSAQGSPACPTYGPGFVLPGFSLANPQNSTYIQVSPGTTPTVSFSQEVDTTNAATTASQITDTRSQTWGYENIFGVYYNAVQLFEATMSQSWTLKWTYVFNNMLTQSNTKTGIANLQNGPKCEGNPCNPAYPPNPDTLYGTAISFDIFVDGRFGTFAFLPSAY